MTSTAFVLVFLCSCGGTAESADASSKEPVCDANTNYCEEKPVTHLMQIKKGQFGKGQVVDDDGGIHDGMHLVCHAEGCAEVKARLTTLQASIKDVKAKLVECGTSRAKLESELGVAAKDRAKAEKALAECATERAKLAADLAQCGKDRSKAEADLAP